MSATPNLISLCPAKNSNPRGNCSPGTLVCVSKRRTEYAPLNPTYRVWPLPERARRLGSLPIQTGLPIDNAIGSMRLMLLPLGPTVLGTLTYNLPSAGLKIMSFALCDRERILSVPPSEFTSDVLFADEGPAMPDQIRMMTARASETRPRNKDLEGVKSRILKNEEASR